ncbi:MAG TPA: DNA-binding domain-containing protein [Allosphingosinicella sp.]|nr:DNA-binding domain-containing protein [Allosphingosinicella sp.]
MSEVAALHEDLQAWLQGAIMAAEPPSAGEVDGRLAGAADFPAAAGLAIYRRAYVARIAAAMRAQFPALCHALGEPLFNDFAADYLRRYPPQSYTLHDLGRRFAPFLEEQRPDRDAPADAREIWIDFMVDLARFERQLFLLFDAPGAEGKALAESGASDARLRLQPAFALGRYDFNVAAYHDAVRRRETPPAPERGAAWIALVRRDYAIRTIALRETEYLFLEAMAGGGCVEDGLAAVAAALGTPPEEADDAWRNAPETRARWLQWGFFVEAES